MLIPLLFIAVCFLAFANGAVGAGIGSGGAVNFGPLGSAFVLPLLLSPLLAFATGAIVYLGFRFVRLRLGVTKEKCVCAGVEEKIIALPQPGGIFAALACWLVRPIS